VAAPGGAPVAAPAGGQRHFAAVWLSIFLPRIFSAFSSNARAGASLTIFAVAAARPCPPLETPEPSRLVEVGLEARLAGLAAMAAPMATSLDRLE
jgi:hypothetical protein